MRWKRSALALTTALGALTVLGCGEDTTGIGAEGEARIQGRVEQTAPEAAAYPTSRSVVAGASGSVSATTVTVAEVRTNGSLNTVAEAFVQGDGSFIVEGVPTDREHLVVVARTASGNAVGRVMVHERTEAGATITTAPITYESTLGATTWAEMKASGKAGATSPAEVALLVHASPTASAAVLANQEVAATAEGLFVATEAMTRVYANAGAAFDASARANAIAQAAVDFSRARFKGTSADAAHEAYLQAAVDAWVQAGKSLDVVTMATAAAASTFDARLNGNTGARGELVAEAVRLNLKARQKLAASVQSGAHAIVALAIVNALASTETSLRGATSAAAIRAALDAQAEASANATVGTMLDLLVPGAPLTTRSEVESKAQAAVQAARLSTRLSAAANADAAAQAVANYRSAVRAAVQAMIEASGRTDLNVDAMTSLYIAAHGGAHVRAG